MNDDRTPVIIGVGQFSERLGEPGYAALSPVELASRAARAACDDAGGEGLAAGIDTIYAIRQFEAATPNARAPFGRSNNFPRSIARRIGADPRRAILPVSGGQGPQACVSEACVSVANGEADLVLLVGSEAISTVRALAGQSPRPDWSETVEGSVDDRGYGLKGLITQHQIMHGLVGAPNTYALFENARRGRLGMTREAYALDEMGAPFARFTEIAAANPHAAAPRRRSAEELIAVIDDNRMIAEPYRRSLVARDQVNQGAAVLVASAARAQALGVPESQWVYLHGFADLKEPTLLDRPDLSTSPAALLACESALACAGITIADINCFDLYSCFPVAVTSLVESLGLSAHDPRGFTVTGGLPYFGGAGNNYAMHAIAETVARLRAAPGDYGLVGANGGVMSKYSVGIYSTRPRPFITCDSRPLQAAIDAAPTQPWVFEADGWARVETYTVSYDKGEPVGAVVVGRLESDGRRFLAKAPDEAPEIVAAMAGEDPLGRRIHVRSFGFGNRFAFDQATLARLYPPKSKTFQPSYEFFLVEQRDHLLEITINRPEVRNCLHPPAHEEMDQIIDAYLAADHLWCAILTGAGDEAFCTGNDLKYHSTGKPVYAPKSGFGGLHRRTDRNKPLIAAVNGFAMGGGFELCLASDLVVADTTAQFALSEVKVGLIAGAGGIVRLPRQIPKKFAVEMFLTGRRIRAERAHELGIVNQVTPAGQALAGARALAAEILEASPTSVRLSLTLLNEMAGIASEDEAAGKRSRIFDEMIMYEDVVEGVQAFVQKRKPQWRNR
ncbi:MAG: acetyl-CoA acetyltransferase [Caulobacter sp.]|nr:acetyl-CoA acetyltransferase [Caulobacter sp.]